MSDIRRRIYNDLSQDYDAGSFEDFTSRIENEESRKKVYNALSEKFDMGSFDEFSKQLGFGKEQPKPSLEVSEDNTAVNQPISKVETPAAPKFGTQFKPLKPEIQTIVNPNITTFADQTPQEYAVGVKEGFKQGSKALGAGLQNIAGEALNVATGSSRDDAGALAKMEQMEVVEKQPLLSKAERKMHAMYADDGGNNRIAMVQGEDGKLRRITDEERQKHKDILLQDEYNKIINEAIDEAGGDVVKAKEILSERAADKTAGDKLIEAAGDKMATIKPTKGFGAWVGNIIPQMIPSTLGMGASLLTKNANVGKLIGGLTMGTMSAATAGQSMKEARDAGATSGQVWLTGLTDGLIEWATEQIPYDRYTKRLFNGTKSKINEALGKELAKEASPLKEELGDILKKANKELNGKLLNGKNVKDYISDIAAEGASEFTAEALQTITPIIYANKEDYPTFKQIMEAGWEGAKAGVFMGAVLGGTSKSLEYAQNRNRRKQQGYVDVAQVQKDGETVIGEVLGLNKENGRIAMLIDGVSEEFEPANITESYRFTFEEFERGNIEKQQDESFEQGYDLVEPQQMNDAQLELEEAENEAIRAFGVNNIEDVDAALNDMPLSSVLSMVDSEEAQQQILNYLNAKARVEGMYQKVRDDIDSAVEESNKLIDSRVNEDTHMIQPATLKTEDRQVYVVSGNIKMFDDGSAVDPANSSEHIIVKDAATGKLEMLSPNDVLRADEAIKPSDEKALAAKVISDELATEGANKIDGVVPFNAGDEYVVMFDDGTQHTAKVITDNGDGNVQVQIDNEPQATVATKEQVQQMVNTANKARVAQNKQAQIEQEQVVEEQAQQEAEKPKYAEKDTITIRLDDGREVRGSISKEADADGNIEVFTEQPIDGDAKVAYFTEEELDGRVVMHNDQAIELPTPEPVTALSQIPVNENSEPLFEQAPASLTYDALVEMNEGDAAEALDTAQQMLAIAKKELKAEEKSTPKVGGNVMEIQKAKAEKKERMKPLQERVAYWESVVNEPTQRKAKEAETSSLAEEVEAPKAEEVAEVAPQEVAEVEPQQETIETPVEELTTTEKAQPIVEITPEESVDQQIEVAEQGTEIEPTEAQKEAGNYKKGHIKIDGFDVTIEIPKGVERKGVDEKGNPWSVIMNNTYGYIRGTEGVDGDHIDIFLSGNLDNWNGNVFVVDQIKPDGSFDEHKVMYGFDTIEDAQAAYLSNYSEGWKGLGSISGTAKEEFKKWIASSHRKTKPFAEYKSVEIAEGQSVEQTAEEAAPAEDVETTNAQQVAAISYKENKRREPLRERAKQWEDSLGVKVNILESFDDITTEDAKAAIADGHILTGWVAGSTVYLYMPNIDNKTEVDRTYLHEVVAHIGLENLMGEEAYNAFCQRVWDEVMTEEQREEYIDYPNVDSEATAAHEYIAHLAEDSDLDQTAWQKIVRIFKDALRALGVDIRLTNEDIRTALIDSYKKLNKAAESIKAEGGVVDTKRGDASFAVKDALKEQGKVSFRFIGEKGAANIDKAEEATIRLDNLAVAREMEEANKSPRTIKEATGWERGADGKWRYEVNDEITAKTIRGLKGAGLKKILEARSKRINDLDKFAYITTVVGVDQLYDADKIMATSWPEAQKKTWLDAYNIYKDDRDAAIRDVTQARKILRQLTNFGKGEFFLYEALGNEHPLFKEYPQMRDVKLVIKPYKGSKNMGGYNRLTNTIEIVDFRGIMENDKGEGTANTLTHEIQHVIQGIEGFARGGNVNMVNPNAVKERNEQAAVISDKIEALKAQEDKLWEEQDSLNKTFEDWYDSHPEDEYKEIMQDEQMSEANKRYSEISEQITSLQDERIELEQQLNDLMRNTDTSLGIEGYKRLAGEVEARNVERRRNMSLGERRNSPAWLTEDVARKDQIFIEDALGEDSVRFRISDYDSEFNALQSEYDALDKNDEQALNEWRNKKRDVVEGYLNHIKNRFGMRSELVVFNGADEAQMQDAYNKYASATKANGHKAAEYDKFKEHSLNPRVFATHYRSGGIITLNVSTKDARNSKERYAVNLFHENAHRVVHDLYGEVELVEIWVDVASSNHKIVERINNSPLYEKKGSSAKGGEFLAYAMSYIIDEHKPLFLKFVKDKDGVTADDVAKKLNIKQRKANFAVTEILNNIKDEYKSARNRKDSELREGVGGDGSGDNLRDSRRDVSNIQGDERGLTKGGVQRGGRGLLDTFLDDVAKRGLRDMVGGKRFNDFLMRAFRDANEPTRRQIANEGLQNGMNFLASTDNYLASLAKQDDVDKEYLNKVKSLFTSMLNEAGVDVGEISDNELLYALWRNNLEDRSLFGIAEDVLMQQKLGVGNFRTRPVGEEKVRFRSAGDQATQPTEGIARQEYDKAVRRHIEGKNTVGKYENVGYKIKEAYMDSMLSVKKLQEAILKEAGGKLLDSMDAYTAENQLSSKNKAEMEAYERDYANAMMEQIGALLKDEASYEEIVDYMLAKHGLERNIVFSIREAEKRGGIWDGVVTTDYAGLTELTGEDKDFTKKAQEIVDKFENKHKTDALWKAINAATKASLKKSYDSGMMDKETYNNVSTMFNYYIPLRGWDNNNASSHYEYIGGSNVKISPALKTAKGRKSRADDPIATILLMGQSSIVQGNRNLMKQRLLNLALAKPTSLLTVQNVWYVKQADGTWRPEYPEIPENATGDEVDAIIKKHEAKMESLGGNAKKSKQGLTLDYRTTAWEGQEHTIRVLRNGKEYLMFVNGNPNAAQAINGFTNPNAAQGKFAGVEEFVNKWTRVYGGLLTSQNPAFMFSNLSRDLIFAGTAVAIKEDAKYAAKYTKNIASILGAGKIFRLLSKWEKGTLDTNKEVERYFKEFLENGGETGFTNMQTLDDYKRNVESFLKKAKGSTIAKAKVPFENVLDYMKKLNRGVEDMTRFAVYMTSRQSGRSITQSIANAKDITVNFNKKGRGNMGAGVMNLLYLFFNATMQSLNNFGGLFKNHPVKATAWTTTMAAAGMLVPMLMAAWGDDDEEYCNLPDWVRRNNLCFRIPTTNVFITIPLPHELRPFYGVGEIFASMLQGKMSAADGLKQAAQGFASLSPIDFLGNDGDLRVNLTPSLFQPLAQLAVNKDYFGTPIQKETPYNELNPAWMKAYKGTNAKLVEATKVINTLGSGEELKSGGWLDWSPAKIEHFFESYLGGMGKTLIRAGKTISMLWNEDAQTWRNVPILSNFVYKADERNKDRVINDKFDEALEEAKDTAHTVSQFKKAAKDPNQMTAMEYAEKLDEFMKSPTYKRYSVINEAKKKITKAFKELENLDKTDRKAVEDFILETKLNMFEELEKLDEQDNQ